MPPTSFRDFVEQVRSAADIADIVGETVKLRRAGNALVGLCPFHNEKTASFRVSPEKGVFHCFGCQAGGDVFTFVAELHGVGFSEAVGLLAERYGIPRPRLRGGDAGPAEDRRRQRVIAALAAAEAWFRAQLDAPAGRPAREYLKRRGLSLDQAHAFGLGWAPPGWEGLLGELSRQGFTPPEIHAAGLAVARKEGDGFYDRFRARVIFPIRDTAGRVVSFGGRALGDETPKYLNGPETLVYDKSRTLFRLSEVAQEVRKSGQIVLVEGYFDAIGLAAQGAPGVVAVCGTALGPAHASLIRRWAPRAVLLFDGDTAGRNAARRALGPLLEAGISVRIASPPPGVDPDDLAREGGAEAVRRLLAEAPELPEFLVAEARREHDVRSFEGRVAAVAMALEHLVMLPGSFARAEAAGRVAAGLGLEDEVMRAELERAARERRRQLRPQAAAQATAPEIAPLEAALLRYLGAPPPAERLGATEAALEGLNPAALGATARAAVERWTEARRRGETWDLRRLAETAAEGEAKVLRALAVSGEQEPGETEFNACLEALGQRGLELRQKEIQAAIDATDDPRQQERLMEEKFALARQIRKPARSREAYGGA